MCAYMCVCVCMVVNLSGETVRSDPATVTPESECVWVCVHVCECMCVCVSVYECVCKFVGVCACE